VAARESAPAPAPAPALAHGHRTGIRIIGSAHGGGVSARPRDQDAGDAYTGRAHASLHSTGAGREQPAVSGEISVDDMEILM
jgi:hypothetical protein